MAEIKSIYALTQSELRLVARDQADAGEPCTHGFEKGSAQAAVFEQAYVARQMELQEADA